MSTKTYFVSVAQLIPLLFENVTERYFKLSRNLINGPRRLRKPFNFNHFHAYRHRAVPASTQASGCTMKLELTLTYMAFLRSRCARIMSNSADQPWYSPHAPAGSSSIESAQQCCLACNCCAHYLGNHFLKHLVLCAMRFASACPCSALTCVGILDSVADFLP